MKYYNYSLYVNNATLFKNVFRSTVNYTLDNLPSHISVNDVTYYSDVVYQFGRVVHQTVPSFPFETAATPTATPTYMDDDYTIVTGVTVSYDVDMTNLQGFPNVTVAYDLYTDQLNKAVADGSFNKTLHMMGLEYHTQSFESAAVDAVGLGSPVFPTHEPTPGAPTYSPTLSLADETGLIFLIIFMIVTTCFIPILCCLCARRSWRKGRPLEWNDFTLRGDWFWGSKVVPPLAGNAV